MNEQTPQPDSEKQAADVASKQARPAQEGWGARMFARMGLTQMTLAALTVVFVWQWLDGHRMISDMQQQLARKIAEMDGASKAGQVLLTQSQGEVRELSAKLAALETRYAEAQNQRAALEALYNDLSVSRDETALAEVEQMLLIAGQQLHLSANVKAALIAMQSADGRLQRMERPAFNGLRKAIGQDMEKLRALPSLDIAGINSQINDMIAAVDGLQLFHQQRVASDDAPAQATGSRNETPWQRLLREVWQDVRQLVRIENTGRTEIPLLSPDQEFFLRENLKLRLLSARLALLSHDEAGFREELKTAQSWVSRYFDGKSAETEQMLSGLKKIAATRISIELPDISQSLQAVRNYRLTHEHAPEHGSAKKTAQ